MIDRKCYVPIKGIDDVIAQKLGWDPNTNKGHINPFSIATLRGLYDTKHQEELDVSNEEALEVAAQTLASYRKELLIKNAENLHSKGTTLIEFYKNLKAAFTAQELSDRANLVATLISNSISLVQKGYPNKTRLEILEGFQDDSGKKIGGQEYFFNLIYNQLLTQHAIWLQQSNGEGKIKADKISAVIDNWGALATYVRIKLRNTEGLKLGNFESFISETDEENFNDNNLTELLNMEESRRESWMESNDRKSAFGSIGESVRRVLSNTPKYIVDSKGNVIIEKDDMGINRTLDPVKQHQQLLDLLRGMTSSTDMMNRLSKLSQQYVWLQPIVKTLQTDPQLRTQFFIDFKKNFQLYSVILRDRNNEKKGIKYYKTKILNKIENTLSGTFKLRIKNTPLLDNSRSVYDENGNIIWKNLDKVTKDIKEWLGEVKSKSSEETQNIFEATQQYGKSEGIFWKASIKEKRDFLVYTSRALGIDLDADTAQSLLSHKKDLNTYIRALKDVVPYGITSDSTVKEAFKNIDNASKKLYYDLVYPKHIGKKSHFDEKVDTMNALISKYREGVRIDSRTTRKDSKGNSVTLYSNINPCYMGDKLELITEYIKKNDRQGLKTFLEENYLCSSYFKQSDGTILNRWLRDMYNACLDPKSDLFNLGEIFSYKRFLGSEDVDFENFTSKQHAIDMIQEFFSDKQISKNANTAWYPVFILGDSGVSKYIRQSIYNEDELLDEFYNVYLQEQQRMKAVSAVNIQLTDLGNQTNGVPYTLIKNFSSSDTEYTFLPFLNEDKYKLPDNPNKEQVKKVLAQYLQDSFSTFKKSITDLGVLNTNSEGTYIELNQIFKTSNNKGIDDLLKEFYFNTKFATIQQLQMMTIDPAFYSGTKDLQKRYKEIHAPGTILDIYAEDFDGRLYSEDATETVIYFDDIEVAAENTFLEVLKANGTSKEIIDKYKKVSLTDGQGYRSLSSYRKVLGMAGKWTIEMEDAYRKILEIRAKGKNSPLTDEDKKLLQSLAVNFQPIKPYMFTHERLPLNETDTQLISVQHKYAEAVLIPELLPVGSKLRDMAYYMEDNNIDMIGSTTICKVGCFGTTSINNLESYDERILSKRKAVNNFNETITNEERLNFALSQAYVHKLSYLDYRIQTNVPEHIHQSQLFGTQIRKLIMANTIHYDSEGRPIDPKTKDNHYLYEHYVDNNSVKLTDTLSVRLNGRNLVAFYNSLIVANQLDSYEKFEKVITDTEGLSTKLIQNIISNSRESLDNILAFALEDGEFSMPLFEGGLEHDTAALMFSIYKKLVNKQTINGGSAVQVSAMGIKDYSEDGGLHYIVEGNNILYSECEIPFSFSYQDSKGNIVELDYDDYCNEDGTFKMKGDKPLIEEKFPGILDIVAYRIPTERAYSMINLKVVRCSRKTSGGTIKVPAAGTAISGSDFDIDKLYFMRKEFVFSHDRKYKNISKDKVLEIWNKVYDEHQDLYYELYKYRNDFGEPSKPLHSYWEDVAAISTRFENYDKNLLFEEAAKKLNINLEEYEEVLVPRYEYHYNKTPLQNTKVARNNMLLHLIQQRLMDPETLEARTTPGGFANASKAARVLRELLFNKSKSLTENTVSNSSISYTDTEDITINWDLLNEQIKTSKDPEPNYDPSDPMTMIIYNQQNQVASKLIGIFANHNTNHALTSLLKTFRIMEGKEIEFADHTARDGYGFDLIRGPKGVDVDLNLAEFLAASVDAVKDPVLNFLNFNTLTADSGALLARLGYNALEIGLLFNQPIIKELCEHAFNNNLRLEEAFKDILAQYKTKSLPTVNTESVTKDALAKNIIKFRQNPNLFKDDSKFLQDQLVVLSLFKNISSTASEVTQFVTSTKFTASNAVGSTYGDLYAQQMKVDNYISKQQKVGSLLEISLTDISGDNLPLKNDVDALSKSKEEYAKSLINNPLSYEQAAFDLNRKAVQVMEKYFPYETPLYKNVREAFRNLTKNKYLDADTINSIHRDLLVYLLTIQERSDFNGNLFKTRIDDKDISSREYYTEYFAEDLFYWLNQPENSKFKEMPIFKYMVFNTDSQNKYDIKIQEVGGLTPEQKESIKDSWASLVTMGEKEQEEGKEITLINLAKDLFLYNFYKLGFDFSPLTFMHLAPIKVKQAFLVPSDENPNRTYVEFLREILKGQYLNTNDTNVTKDFVYQYILNHPDNYRLVYQANSNSSKSIMRDLTKGLAGATKDTFVLDIEQLKNSGKEVSSFIIDTDRDGIITFVPAINYNGMVYIADIDNSNNTKTSMTYKKVSALGSKTTKSYSITSESSSDNTIVPEGTFFDSTTEGNSSVPSEDVPTSEPSYTKENLIDTMIELLSHARDNVLGEPMFSQKGLEDIRNSLRGYEEATLQQDIKTIKQILASGKDVFTIDEEGNPIPLC